jgi:hypothetical protein
MRERKDNDMLDIIGKVEKGESSTDQRSLAWEERKFHVRHGHRLDAKNFAKIFRFPVTSNL